MTSPRPEIVVLRALGLGDLLTTVPALRALRRAFPRERIVLAAPPELAPIAALTGAVDELTPTAGLGRLPERTEAPKLAVNLHGNGPNSIAELVRIRPHKLITYRHPDYPTLPGPPWRRHSHEVHRWCRLLQHAGIPADPGDLFLHRPAPERRRPGCIIVHPGAGASARRWPPRRFAEVVAQLRRSGHQVVITGTAAERGVALAVARSAGLPTGDVLAGALDLEQTAALVADSALVVCGDTGIGHLATALATRSVLLFGPTPPQWWGPPADSRARHIVLWAGNIGDPHGRMPDPGLLRITVDEVLAAAETQLAGRDRPPGTELRQVG